MKKNEKFHPGPQRKIFTIDKLSLFLYLFILIFFLLTVQAIVYFNPAIFIISKYKIFQLKILELGAAITLLSTFIGLLLARNNISYGLRPYIVYECLRNRETKSNLASSSKYLSVNLKNVGLGVAIIKSVSYKIELKKENEKDRELKYESYSSVVDKFLSIGLTNRRDFFLLEISNGFALSSKDEKNIFEIPILKLEEVKHLDIKIIFKSFLGTKYSKEIYCIPKKGIEYQTS